MKLVSGLGEIVVSVFRTRYEAQVDWPIPSKLLNDAPTEIAEKALKGRALSHGIGFVPRLLCH